MFLLYLPQLKLMNQLTSFYGFQFIGFGILDSIWLELVENDIEKNTFIRFAEICAHRSSITLQFASEFISSRWMDFSIFFLVNLVRNKSVGLSGYDTVICYDQTSNDDIWSPLVARTMLKNPIQNFFIYIFDARRDAQKLLSYIVAVHVIANS